MAIRVRKRLHTFFVNKQGPVLFAPVPFCFHYAPGGSVLFPLCPCGCPQKYVLNIVCTVVRAVHYDFQMM